MPTSPAHSMRADELPKLLIAEDGTPASEPSQSVFVPILLVVLAALIVVGSWWLLSSLFVHSPSATPPTTKSAPTPRLPATNTNSVSTSAAVGTSPLPLVESAATRAESNVADNDLVAVVSELEERNKSKPTNVSKPTPNAMPERARAGEVNAKPMPGISKVPAARTAARGEQPMRESTPAAIKLPVAISVDPVVDTTRAVRVPRPAIDLEIKQPQPARVEPPAREPSSPADVADVTAMIAAPEPVARKFAQRWNGVVVIVNKANTQALSRSDVSNIYRDRITRWPSGERILAFNLPLESGERQRFSTEILAMSPLDAETELSNRTITNRSQNEYRTKNVQVVVSYVERHANAIGYVPAAAVGDNDNVRVVFSLP